MLTFLKGNIDDLEGKVKIFVTNEKGDPFKHKTFFYPGLEVEITEVGEKSVKSQTKPRRFPTDLIETYTLYDGDVIMGPKLLEEINGSKKMAFNTAISVLHNLNEIYCLTYFTQETVSDRENTFLENAPNTSTIEKIIISSQFLLEKLLKGLNPEEELKNLSKLTNKNKILNDNINELSNLIKYLDKTPANREYVMETLIWSVRKMKFYLSGDYASMKLVKTKIQARLSEMLI